MTTIVVAILAALAFAWVIAAVRTGGTLTAMSPERDALAERKIAALSALADLDEELSVGKITSEDHAALRKKYEADAVDVLHDIVNSLDR